MIRAQIVGATGYGGLGMTEMLLRHPEIELVSLLAKTDVGKPLSDFFPHLRGFCDQIVDDASPENIGKAVDLVIFATPDRIGMSYAPAVLAKGIRMLDYSGDFRFATVEQYQEYSKRHPSTVGKPHLCPELLAEAVYGVPELNRARIKGAKLVGNPGCFAIAMILGLAPAMKSGLVDPRSVICDGKTGVSGAGKKASAMHHFPERNENTTPYRVAAHQHEIEVTQTLSAIAGERVTMTFVPHVVPATRGILITAYANLKSGVSATQAREAYAEFYRGEPFVRVLPAGAYATPKSVTASNFCDVSLAVDEGNDRLVVISAIDNLVKGQAGVALENINLMFGFPETMGIERAPIYP
jgi:N-acetyl-gamma-glutamyl-phosphate reductase